MQQPIREKYRITFVDSAPKTSILIIVSFVSSGRPSADCGLPSPPWPPRPLLPRAQGRQLRLDEGDGVHGGAGTGGHEGPAQGDAGAALGQRIVRCTRGGRRGGAEGAIRQTSVQKVMVFLVFYFCCCFCCCCSSFCSVKSMHSWQ